MSDDRKRQILSAALGVFSRYGYKRVNMHEIAAASGLSRQGLYLHFKTKEEVFSAAVEQRAEALLEEISRGIENENTVEDKILYAFDVWTIRNFDEEVASTEAREIQEATHAFMGKSFDKMRLKFEAVLASVLTEHCKRHQRMSEILPEQLSHLFYSAMRGFKLSAKNGTELRKMIHSLLKICL